MRKQELHPRTAIINKKQKNQSKIARLDALQWLAAKFPKAFDNSQQIRPLKLGIMDDILKHTEEACKDGISKSKLREAVVVFTRRIDYLTTLKSREMRIDLAGNPVAEVTEEEAERASIKIKRRVEKSARNARKASPAKPAFPVYPKSTAYDRAYDRDARYDDEREPSYFTQNAPVKAPSVMIKNKSSRQLDPEAVARLKAKLGIAKKKEETTSP